MATRSTMKNEIITKQGKLNEVILHVTNRKNSQNSVRIQQDFEFCPTMSEQHSAHVTDINYLMETMKPDALAAYISQRNIARQEIIGHDFSNEPSLQGAKNITYNLKKSFDDLPQEVRMHFKNHVEFLKFIDNPSNQEKMLKLGLMTKKEIKDNTLPDPIPEPTTNANPNATKTSSTTTDQQTKKS